MNLYRISQSVNDGYDTFDRAVVAAQDEATARRMHPSAFDGQSRLWTEGSDNKDWTGNYPTWAKHPNEVTVELIGVAADGVPLGVIVASFNAG